MLVEMPFSSRFSSFSPSRSFSTIPPPSVPQTPGAKPGDQPSVFDQGVGKDWEEATLAKEGIDRFERGPIIAPFGTISSPAIVWSAFDQRIVGCIGGAGHTHRLFWFNLKLGKKHVCKECGQVFKLQSVESLSAEEKEEAMNDPRFKSTSSMYHPPSHSSFVEPFTAHVDEADKNQLYQKWEKEMGTTLEHRNFPNASSSSPSSSSPSSSSSSSSSSSHH